MTLARTFLALASLSLAGSALAQGTAEQRTACGPEAVRLCASSIPNVAKITACLREKRDSLNEACRTAMDAAGAEQQPKVAEAPQAPEPPAKPDTTSARADAKAVEPDAKQRIATPRPALRFHADKAEETSVRPRATRRRTAVRSQRRRTDSDMAEAMYWMRRVTGHSIAIDSRAFERNGLGGLATLLR